MSELADFLTELEAGGRPLELWPWQRTVLERGGLDDFQAIDVVTARRSQRREAAATAMAIAALEGHTIAVASTSREQATELYDRATAILEAWGELVGLDVELPRGRLKRAQTSPTFSPRQAVDPRQAGGSPCRPAPLNGGPSDA